MITHEFFHLIGVNHGGQPLNGGTDRALITTPAQALDSADNLAQLVAAIAAAQSTGSPRPSVAATSRSTVSAREILNNWNDARGSPDEK